MRQDAVQNKKRIEQKATNLFAQYGVDSISMNRISKELGIGMATLYRHFEDKSALCYELIQNDFSSLFESMEEVKNNPQLSKEAKLDQYLSQFLAFKSEHAELLNCVETKKQKEDFRNSGAFQQLFTYFFDALKSNDDDHSWVTFKTDMFLNALTTHVYQFQYEQRKLSNNHIKEYLITLFKTN